MRTSMAIAAACGALMACSSNVAGEGAAADTGTAADTSATPDTFVLDTFTPDTHVPDTFVPDTFVPDTFAPDTYVADTYVPDTFSPDTAIPDVGGEVAPDAPVFTSDRALTVLFAAPDLGTKFMCLGAFLASDDPATKLAPIAAFPRTGATGHSYGAVAPVAVTEELQAALGAFTVVVYLLDTNPAASSKTCADMWSTVSSDPKRWHAIPRGAIAAGQHGVVVIHGCANAATSDGACGSTGLNLKYELLKVSMTKPSSGTLGLQFLHLSQFAGMSSLAGFQNVDVYLAAAGGGGAPTLFKVANNVRYNDVTSVLGVTLPSGTTNAASSLVVAPRVRATDAGLDSYECVSGGAPTTACPNWTFSLAPFFSPTDGYQLVGGGLEFANTNQVVALVGSPIAGTTGAASLRVPFLRAARF